MRYFISILLFGWIGIIRCFATPPPISLDDLFISTTMKSVDIELSVMNRSKHTQQCEVDIIIKEESGKTFTHLPQQTLLLKAGESRNLKFSKKNLKPNLWSPEDPFLYKMYTNINVGSDYVVKDIRKIGFKSFEVRGHLFYLNEIGRASCRERV